MSRTQYALTDLQKVYCMGQKKEMVLGGIASHAYMEIIVSNAIEEKLEKALCRLVEVQDVFRAVIQENFFVIEEKMPVEIAHYNITNLKQEEQEKALEDISDKLFDEPFDMENGPLFRFAITKLSASDSIVHICHAGVIADGQSHQVILENLQALYEGKEVNCATTFQEYAAYLEEQKKDENFLSDKEMLLSRYEEYDFQPELPMERGENEILSVQPRQVTFQLSNQEYQSLEDLAKESGMTIFALLFTVFGKTLSMYTQNRKFLMNIPVANRNIFLDGMDNLVGLCSNFILFDFDDSMKRSIYELAEENQEKLFSITEYNTCQGTDLIKELQKKSSGALIAPVVFTSTIGGKHCKSRMMQKRRTRSYTSQVWLEVLLTETMEGILVAFSYVEGLLQQGIPEKIGESFLRNLKLLISGQVKGERDCCFPVLEKEQTVIEKMNQTEKEISKISLPEILEENFRLYGAKKLLCGAKESLTYRQVKEKAQGLITAVLANTRPSKEFVAGIYLPKSMAQVVCEIALFYAGITFLPIDMELPEEAVWECVDRVGINLIITNRQMAQKLGQRKQVSMLQIEDVTESEERIVSHFNERPVIINTSGTTGVSKSVGLRHEAIVNCILDTKEIFSLTDKNTCFAITNYCHDMSLFDVIGMVVIGGSIVIPEGIEKEPEEWINLMKQHEVNVWNSVPALMQMLMLADHTEKQYVVEKLQTVILGGDYLHTNLAEELRKVNPEVRIFNVGGPSETTIWNIYHEVEDEDIKTGVIPYGKPFPNTKYHILNEKLELCPMGVTGTMYIEGLGVAMGYVGNEKETQQKFVEYKDTIVYDSGDCGTYTEAGEILISGRKDLQIKIMGKRIEIGVVENALAEVDGVSMSAVVYDKKKNKLVGCYMSENIMEDGKLSRELSLRLPAYMLPAKFVQLEQIPLTPNGKVDRKALMKVVEDAELSEKKTNDRADNEIMKKLYQFCEEVFESDEIYEEGNFYEMGGDSISAMKMVGKIKRNFKIAFSVTDILGNPQLTDVENIIRKRMATC